MLQAIQNQRARLAPEMMNKAEMAELTRKADEHLAQSTAGDAHQNLDEAHSIFLRILSAQQTQQPRAKDKELCHTYNKLRSTCHRLSQLNLDASQRMKHIISAAKYGDQAIKFAEASKNAKREAQMRFYRACVEAQKIQLRTVEQRFQAPTEIEIRNAREAIEVAWKTLQSIGGLEIGLYESMHEQGLRQLFVRS